MSTILTGAFYNLFKLRMHVFALYFYDNRLIHFATYNMALQSLAQAISNAGSTMGTTEAGVIGTFS